MESILSSPHAHIELAPNTLQENWKQLRRVLEAPKGMHKLRSMFEGLLCDCPQNKCTAPNNHLCPDVAFCMLANSHTGALMASILIELESSGIVNCTAKDSLGSKFFVTV